MAVLSCLQCGEEIDSDTRRTQCRGCGALFPFQCAVCEKKLRSPFPVFDDERFLSLDSSPQPLCEDHFLRKCPDCDAWFQADQNPGYFRCSNCAQKLQNAVILPEWSDDPPARRELLPEQEIVRAAPAVGNGRDSNTMILGAAGCALLVLMGWLLMGR